MTGRVPGKFAASGDTTPIDQTDAQGKVNWTAGYGPDYERKIGEDPNAKAVERQKQNWLFGLLTENLNQWQNQAFPDWRGTQAGTDGIPYDINACVRYTVDGNVYRALQAVPANTSPLNATYWEVLPTMSFIKSLSAMPAGGGTPSQERVTTAKDPATLKNGTWEYADVAASSPNLPAAVGGMLESKTWVTNGVINATVQRYTAKTGIIWYRATQDGNVWSDWEQIQNRSELINRGYFEAPAVTDCNAVTETGFYSGIASAANLPPDVTAGASFMLMVTRRQVGTAMLEQMLFTDNATSSTGAVWVRSMLGTTWRTWRRIAERGDIPAPVIYPKSVDIDFDNATTGTYYLGVANYTASTGIKPVSSGAGILTVVVNGPYTTQTYQDYLGQFFYRGKGSGAWTPWVRPGGSATSLGGYGIGDALANANSWGDNLVFDDQFMDTRWTGNVVAGLTWQVTQANRAGWPGKRLVAFSGNATVPTGSGIQLFLPSDMAEIPVMQNPSAETVLGVSNQVFDIGFTYSFAPGAIGRVGLSIGAVSGSGAETWSYFTASALDGTGTAGLTYTNRYTPPAGTVRLKIGIGAFAEGGGTAMKGDLNIGAPFIRQATMGKFQGYINGSVGKDFNKLTESGVYMFTNDAALINSPNKPPSNASGALTTSNTKVNIITQMYVDYNGQVSARGSNGGVVWSPWVTAYSAADLDVRGIVSARLLTTENLNSLTYQGTFQQTGDSGATLALNYPTPLTAGILEVTGKEASSQTLQKYTSLQTDTTGGTVRGGVFTRNLYNNAWSPWVLQSKIAVGHGAGAPPARPDGSPWQDGDLYFVI